MDVSDRDLIGLYVNRSRSDSDRHGQPRKVDLAALYLVLARPERGTFIVAIDAHPALPRSLTAVREKRQRTGAEQPIGYGRGFRDAQ